MLMGIINMDWTEKQTCTVPGETNEATIEKVTRLLSPFIRARGAIVSVLLSIQPPGGVGLLIREAASPMSR